MNHYLAPAVEAYTDIVQLFTPDKQELIERLSALPDEVNVAYGEFRGQEVWLTVGGASGGGGWAYLEIGDQEPHRVDVSPATTNLSDTRSAQSLPLGITVAAHLV